MPFGDYQKIRVVGNGSYGEIWLVRSHINKKEYVIKEMPCWNKCKKEQKVALKEVELLSTIQHPNIVAYKESFSTKEGRLQIVMDFCAGGDLYSILKKRNNIYLEEKQVVEWAIQIALALRYLHEKNILHRDLKTQNIFLSKSNIIKVGDFGISRVLDSSSDMATTIIGTPYYMSPELFSNRPYNYKSDVWAFGCCMYEMLSLRHAFDASTMHSLVFKIIRGKFPPLPQQYSPTLVELVKQTLDLSPDKRPSIRRFLSTTFIRQNIQNLLESIKKRSIRSNIKSRMSSITSSYSDFKSSSEEKSRLFRPKSDPILNSPLANLKRPPSPPKDRPLSARERRRRRLSESENSQDKITCPENSDEKPKLIRQELLVESVPKHLFLDSLKINRRRLIMKKENKNGAPLVILADKPLTKMTDSDFSELSDISEPTNGEIDKLAVCLGNTLQTVDRQEETAKRPPPLPRHQSFRNIRPQIDSIFTKPNRNDSRLSERIKCLRKECVDSLGLPLFDRVMSVISVCLDNEIEGKLVELLGKNRTTEHIKLFNELKFCQDMATEV